MLSCGLRWGLDGLGPMIRNQQLAMCSSCSSSAASGGHEGGKGENLHGRASEARQASFFFVLVLRRCAARADE